MKVFGWIALGAAVLVGPGIAAAQGTTEWNANPDQGDVTVNVHEQQPDQSEVVTQKQHKEKNKYVDVQGSGGMATYTGEAAGLTSPAGAYGVLVGLNPLPLAGLELSYQGSAYQTDQRLPGPQENIIENGGQALLDVGPKLGMIEPYAFGGYQLSRLNVYEREGATNPVQDDTISRIPAGVGLDFNVARGMLVGARGQFNFMIHQDAFPTLDNSNTDSLNVMANLGGQF